MRLYITDFDGDGIAPETQFIAHFATLGQTSKFRILDMRRIANVNGECLVWSDNTSAEHLLALADPRISYIAIENDDNSELLWDDDLSTLSDIKFAQLSGDLNSRNIPTEGLSKLSTVIEIFERVVKTHLVLKQIRYIDVFDSGVSMSSQWGLINSLARTVMTQRLTEKGLNSFGNDSKTVSQALIDLGDQIPSANLSYR